MLSGELLKFLRQTTGAYTLWESKNMMKEFYLHSFQPLISISIFDTTETTDRPIEQP